MIIRKQDINRTQGNTPPSYVYQKLLVNSMIRSCTDLMQTGHIHSHHGCLRTSRADGKQDTYDSIMAVVEVRTSIMSARMATGLPLADWIENDVFAKADERKFQFQSVQPR